MTPHRSVSRSRTRPPAPTVAGVIPARYGSTRFPGKPLALLQGRPLILHVCERAAQARRLTRFWVATDDVRIADVVRAAGYEARLTPSACATGTDRMMASLRRGDRADVLVNLQGDEPQMEPATIDAVVAALLASPDCGVATAAVPIRSAEAFASPHVVKVVLDARGRALYFSRAPIPSAARWTPPADAVWGYKHLGLYAYRRAVARAFARWAPTPLERRECLEQLRLLEHGVGMQVVVVTRDSIGVDTPDDLTALELQANPSTAR